MKTKKAAKEKVKIDSNESMNVNEDIDTEPRNIVNNLTQDTLPVLPLKDIVIFPYMIYPILAGRDSSIRAINKASEDDKNFIFLVAQKDGSIDDTSVENLYNTGVIAKILQVIRMPNGLIKILVDAVVAAKVISFYKEDYIYADIRVRNDNNETDSQIDLLDKRASKLFEEYVTLNPALTKDSYTSYEVLKEYDKRLYFISSTIAVNFTDKQKILETESLYDRYFNLITLLVSEVQVLKIEKEIEAKVSASMQKNQRKFIVQEQIRILAGRTWRKRRT